MVHTGKGIHPTAIISPGAEIGEGTSIGPYSCIGSHVKIGKNNRIGSHVVVEGRTTLGDENVIYQFASIGAEPQDLKYKGEPSTLTIGHKNLIREYVTIQPGTTGGGMKTVVGSLNLFMACSHVGHDAIVGDHNVFANGCALAGHVSVGSRVTVGGLSGVHQFVRLGDLCILGAGSMVSKDIPPFCMAQGDRAYLVGLNLIGIERAGISKECVSELKGLFRQVFLREGLWKDKMNALRTSSLKFKESSYFSEFLTGSARGITLNRRSDATSPDSAHG